MPRPPLPNTVQSAPTFLTASTFDAPMQRISSVHSANLIMEQDVARLRTRMWETHHVKVPSLAAYNIFPSLLRDPSHFHAVHFLASLPFLLTNLSPFTQPFALGRMASAILVCAPISPRRATVQWGLLPKTASLVSGPSKYVITYSGVHTCGVGYIELLIDAHITFF